MTNSRTKPISLGASALLLAVLLTACQSAPMRSDVDLRRLQGNWEGYGPGGECSVTISGNSLFYAQTARDATTADFWYETTFTLLASTEPKQLHATIVKNSTQADIGKVVVTIFKIEDGKLTLGVVDDFEGSPGSVVGDWDWVADIYHLERAPNVSPATLSRWPALGRAD